MSSSRTTPQRILMTADTVGGVWTYALELVRALAPEGIFVTLATMGGNLSPAQSREAAAIQNLEIIESNFKLEWMEHPWQDVADSGDWLLDIERRVRPEVIHLNGYAHAALPWSAPVVVVGHSCVLSWWKAVEGEEAPPVWGRYHQAVQAGVRAAELVVAPSRWMLNQLHHYYGPLPKACVIYNGRSAPDIAREEKEPIIFAAGRLWDDAKNIILLARIAPK